MYSTGSKNHEKSKNSPPPGYEAADSKSSAPLSSGSSLHVEGSHPAKLLESKNRDPWSSGLCDCTSDFRNCCITCWCPCITFGQIAEIVDRGSSACGTNGALYTLIGCVTGFCCFYSCFYRAKMRQHYALRATPCGDCLVHCCCEYCALCQEYRELKFRGYDMAIGWHGNLERKHREARMAPKVEESMTK